VSGASIVLGALFLFIESRAKEPIIPLDMFRNRTFASSIFSTFFVSFGFFGAIIFLPRWFQFVRGDSATISGYQTTALLIGLIISSIVAGQIVSRTGRYKVLILGGLGLMAVGLALMTQLKTGTDLPMLWLWMFITGLGIGPTLSVFTIVVQNAVPFRQLGVATSNLTFFRQIGGSVGLAVTGTVFGTALADNIPGSLVANGVPQQSVDQFAGQDVSALDNLVGVGQDLGAAILASVPAQFQEAVRPIIPNIVAGIHDAFSIAIGTTFQVGVVTTIIALVIAMAMKELPLRTTIGEPAAAPPPDRGDVAGAPGATTDEPPSGVERGRDTVPDLAGSPTSD